MTTPKVAVAGCGYWGRNLVRNFAQLGALAAVADPDPNGRAKAAEMAPGVPVYDSLTAILEGDAPAVVIATPAETHYDLAKAALLAGKDVFCEKPLALQYAHAAELVGIAEANGRILMVGHILEYHPAIHALSKLISDGELGRVQYIYSNRLNLGKVRQEENILWSFAPHDIAVILRLVGALPFQVGASGGSYVTANIADVTVTHLLFDNGVAAHIFVSWLNPFKEQRLVVVGSKKMAVFDDVKKELVLYDQHVDVTDNQPVPFKGDGRAIPYSSDEPLKLECQAFLDAIASRKSPITDGRSACRVLRVLQAAQRSLITQGQPVVLPLE